MSWLAWFGLALVITVFAAVTGIKAKGTRPVARTQLMGVARWVLWLTVLAVAYLAYRAAQ
jgi:putative effector of murein hydrolase